MRTNRWAYPVVAALAVFMFALLVRQRHETSELRGQIEKSREEETERVRLIAEARKLVPSQRSAEELERLREEHNAVSALRAEIAAMKRRSESVVRPSAGQVESQADKKSGYTLLKGESVSGSGEAMEEPGCSYAGSGV